MGNASLPMAELATLLKEKERYRAALERIARQGLGVYVVGEGHRGDTGEKWEHWATIARNALEEDDTDA